MLHQSHCEQPFAEAIQRRSHSITEKLCQRNFGHPKILNELPVKTGTAIRTAVEFEAKIEEQDERNGEENEKTMEMMKAEIAERKLSNTTLSGCT